MAVFSGLDNGVAPVEGGDVGADVFGGFGGFVHFFLEELNVVGVVFEGGAYLFFEVVDYNKIGEERDEIFDFDELALFEELKGSTER